MYGIDYDEWVPRSFWLMSCPPVSLISLLVVCICVCVCVCVWNRRTATAVRDTPPPNFARNSSQEQLGKTAIEALSSGGHATCIHSERVIGYSFLMGRTRIWPRAVLMVQ